MSRLEAITSATDNLNRCVRERGKLTAQGDRWGVTLGEMDWLEELHRLLYEENTEMLTQQEQRDMADELVPDSLDPRPLANWNGEPVKLWSAPGKTEEILSAARPGIGGAPTRATTLPADAAGRKEYPVASGFMDYFPDAIAAVSNLSKKGNDQHNPGQPLHWARGKSGDESDTMMRHFLQRGTLDTDGIRHTVKMAWRAMAILQKEIEGEK